MRKYTFILIITVFISTGAFFTTSNAYADGSVVDSPAVVTSNTDGTANVTITGTLSTSDLNAINHGVTGTTAEIRYGTLHNNETDAQANQDANKDVSCTIVSQTTQKFTCEIDSLTAGNYLYRAGVDIPVHDVGGNGLVIPDQFNPFFSGYKQFVVTSSSASQLAVSFVSVGAITPHVPGPAGYDFPVTMSVSHLTTETSMSMLLGTATQIGNSATYSCVKTSYTSASTDVTPTTVDSPTKQAIFKFSGVMDGNYCLSVQETVAGLVSVTTGTGLNGDFLTARGSIIHVGNAAPLDPNATNAQGANPTGCVTNSDNSNYCMLAPLPGLGDGSGNLSVTSFGDYVLAIIKIVFGLIGVLSVFMIVFGGIEYMTGTSAGEKEGGKSRITNAIFGLLLALVSYIILNTLNPRLVTLGVAIPQVAVTGDATIDDPPTGTNNTTFSLNNNTYTTLCPQVNGTVNVSISSDGGATKSSMAYPIVTGFVWPSDNGVDQTITLGGKNYILYGGTERKTLTNAGIILNASNPATVGSYKDGVSVTSVYGLGSSALNGLVSLAGSCGANCVVVTGGTECWDHKKHGPGLNAVDLRTTPALMNYVQTGSGRTLVVGQDYNVGTIVFNYEDTAHFHVKSW